MQARNHNVPKSGLGRDGIAQLARSTGDGAYRVIHSIKVLESIQPVTKPLTSIASLGLGSEVERVHTSFMFTDAAGRISSKNPDIMSVPPDHKYPGLAERWRACLAYSALGRNAVDSGYAIE